MSNLDFFDKNIKGLFTQRVKHYFFDLLYFLNITAKPYHIIKRFFRIYDDKKINMGCGATYLKGWINADANPLRKNDLWLDVRSKWPFNNSSIKGFVAAHIIEHLYDEELLFFFIELKRVVEPGGFVHIEVPSLEILIDNYTKNKNGSEFNETCFWHGAHRQVFDYGRLEKLFNKFGFEVKYYFIGVKKSQFLTEDDLNEICLRPEQSLIIEAIKL